MGGALLVASLAVPALMLLACLKRSWLKRMPALLALAPVLALASALFAGDVTVGTGRAPFYLTLMLDRPGALLLGTVALLWITAGAFAASWLRDQPRSRFFTVCWLLTLLGNIAVLLAADIAGFYLAFALVSIPAYGLVVFDDTARVHRSGLIYIGLTILGETLLLLGLVLLSAAAPDHSLLIRDAVAALPGSPWRDATLLFTVLGLALKIGLVPLHVLLPLSYAPAPFAAAAVLSGAGVKAGVIGLMRFLPMATALPGWGLALAMVGLVSTFYGVLVGVTQRDPKAVLAYSSISQMGIIATVLGMGQATGSGPAILAVAFYAAHHVLVKGGLFLALGVAARTERERLWPVLLPASLLALSLAGLPLTGGMLAKLAVKDTLGDGWIGQLASLSSVTSALLMLHFLLRMAATTLAGPDEMAPRGLRLSWLATALAALLLPWLLYPLAMGAWPTGTLAADELWKACWPILVGALLALGLYRWGSRLPAVPEGDIIEPGLRASGTVAGWFANFDRLDARLREWPVAGVLMLALAVALGGLMLAGG